MGKGVNYDGTFLNKLALLNEISDNYISYLTSTAKNYLYCVSTRDNFGHLLISKTFPRTKPCKYSLGGYDFCGSTLKEKFI